MATLHDRDRYNPSSSWLLSNHITSNSTLVYPIITSLTPPWLVFHPDVVLSIPDLSPWSSSCCLVTASSGDMEAPLCEIWVADLNPELVARLERLKREQENRQYAQMTRDMGKKPGQGALSDFGSEAKEVKVYLMALINFMVSVAAAFTFGYVGSEYAFGASVTLRVMTGIILATMVAMADIYFMAKVVEEEVEKHEKRN
uniref:Transmembrane protein 199 n=1 Tax=Branchiostoma floridae TaxID=7739 RepID=C3XUK2_BRAFL|eukprot:XP_002612275.1 hypothetical protein BRAFLDRAFT_104890 [Branchiostoma floridae]